MKIKRVELENFRGHSHTVMDTDSSFIVIRGLNWAGKSSIAQGISMALTPSTISLPTDGKGFVKKIKKGATKAVITVDIQGGTHLVRQEVTLNTNTTGRTPKSICLDDEDWKPLPFDNLLKAKKDALLVACNTDHFLHSKMDEDDQKNLMAKLVLPSRYDFPKDKIEAVQKAIGEGAINFDEEPFAVIAKAYKKLYDERQAVNRQVKDFVVPDPLPLTDGIDSASLQAKLSTSRDARQRILTEKDAAVKKASDHENERTRVQTKLNGIETAIAEEKAKLPNVEAVILPESKYKELAKVAAGKEVADEYTKDRVVVSVTIETLKTEVDRINSLLEKFSDAGAKCPTCDQEVDMRVLEGLLKDVQVELTEAQEKDTTILRGMKILGDVDGAVAAIAKHDAAKTDMRAINQVITEKEKMAQVGKEKLASMGAKVDAAAQFEEPLMAADNEITALTEQLRPVIAAEERTKEITTKSAQLEKLKVKAAAINELVVYFDKDGIKAKLLQEHIGTFQDKINEVMLAFNYVCVLSIEPYQFLVTSAKGDTNPVSELSGAEERIFAAAFQCAVSRAAGLGIAVIDEVDRLQPEIRPTLFKALYSLVQQKIMEQIFLIVADSKKDVPVIPDARFFFVEDGMVYRLGEV